MSTETLDNRAAFNRYLDERFGGDLNGTTLKQALADYREYQQQLAAVQVKLQRSMEASERGASKPLDDEAFWASANTRMDAI